MLQFIQVCFIIFFLFTFLTKDCFFVMLREQQEFGGSDKQQEIQQFGLSSNVIV